MTILFTVLHIIVCFVLIFVILVQGGRGQGLSGPSFSSGNVQSLFGTQAADFLTKATTVSAICFLFTCIALNVVEARKSKSLLAGARQAAPVDIEAVKKALEKIQAEKGATTDTAKKEVANLVDNAKAAAQTAADNTKQAVDQAAAETTAAVKKAEQDTAGAIAAVKASAESAKTDAAKS